MILLFQKSGSQPLPVPAPPPAPPPPPAPSAYHRYGTSKIYHKLSHYGTSSPVTDLTGLRPCKVCGP